MRERPILFNGAMVRAILAGRKVQTRRVVTPRHLRQIDPGPTGCRAHWSDPMPFGRPGDRLWVRETTVNVEDHGYLGPVYLESDEGRACIDGGLAPAPDDMTEVEPWEIKLRPSIHMPRSMCRLMLEITDVRVERLQAISDADCWAEGAAVQARPDQFSVHSVLGPDGKAYLSPRGAFHALWTSTGGDWDANPWVWAISFRPIAVPEVP